MVGKAPLELIDDNVLDPENTVERLLAMYVALFVAMLPSPYREALTLTRKAPSLGVVQRAVFRTASCATS